MKRPTSSPRNARRRRPRAAAPRYRFQRFLCTPAEWRFYRALDRSVGDRFDIMLQVRVAAVLRPLSRELWERDGRRVSQKAFDFVLVSKASSRVQCAIELDDRTHAKAERRSRDCFLNRACKRAGLPLLRVRAARDYCEARLRAEIQSCIHARKGPRKGETDDGTRATTGTATGATVRTRASRGRQRKSTTTSAEPIRGEARSTEGATSRTR